ncbi:MAG TPA: tRNA lysidine(34) synthetase TilS [Candidatus Binatia bacterium]|jgi:tRNA(Ile)-lysidine synthase
MGIGGGVLSFIKTHKLLDSGDRVLVAVSGGPDSVALLHLLYELREELELHLEIGHLQHGIRGEEARGDARFVAELADKLGLPFHLEEVDLPRIKFAAGKGNVEALARAERYRFFVDVARQRKLNKIATAHTQDDQAETVLMWFLRGSGMKGLGGMLPRHELEKADVGSAGGPVVIRPLLDVSRAEVEAYLKEKRLAFRLDRTNQDPTFLRNWIRLKLIPQLKEKMDQNLPARLAQQAELLREEEQFLAEFAHAELYRIQTREGIDRRELLKYNKALQRRLLRLWIEAVRGHLRGLDFQHVEALCELVTDGPPQGSLSIPGGWQLVREYENLKLEKQSRGIRPACSCYTYNLRIGEDLYVDEAGLMIRAREIVAPLPSLPDELTDAFFDISLASELTLRNFRPGDRLQPLGMAGHRKVKEIFIEKKVPLSVRASLPLLVLGDEVIWIPGYGRSEVGKVTPATKAILHLKAVPVAKHVY